MTFFAVLDTEKNAYLPGGGRGGTWREPNPDQPPRLFRRRQDAQAALDWWLQGPGICRRYGYDYEDSDDFYQSPDMLRTAKQRQARAHLMKVVDVDLVQR